MTGMVPGGRAGSARAPIQRDPACGNPVDRHAGVAAHRLPLSTGMKLRTLALLLIVTACDKGERDPKLLRATAPVVTPIEERATPPGRAPVEPTTLQVLGDLGYSLDVPASWTLKQLNANAYTFRIPSTKQGGVIVMPRLDISRMPNGPQTLETATKLCAGELPSGWSVLREDTFGELGLAQVVEAGHAAPLDLSDNGRDAGEPWVLSRRRQCCHAAPRSPRRSAL